MHRKFTRRKQEENKIGQELHKSGTESASLPVYLFAKILQFTGLSSFLFTRLMIFLLPVYLITSFLMKVSFCLGSL